MTDQPGAPAGAPNQPAAAPVDNAASTPAAPGTQPATTPATDPAAPAPRKVDGRTRRISELTYEKHDLRRQLDKANELLAEALKGRQAPATPTARPKLSDFNTFEEYEDARDAWRESMRAPKSEPKAEQPPKAADRNPAADPEFQSNLNEFYEEATEKYEDFEEVFGNPSLKITPAMGSFVLESEHRVDLAYYLGNNPKEAARIAKLSPVRQVAELTRLEDKIASKTVKPQRPSSAPAPINPVDGKSSNDTPSAANMTQADFNRARRSGKKLKELLG